jgi:hypothetical protein
MSPGLLLPASSPVDIDMLLRLPSSASIQLLALTVKAGSAGGDTKVRLLNTTDNVFVDLLASTMADCSRESAPGQTGSKPRQIMLVLPRIW